MTDTRKSLNLFSNEKADAQIVSSGLNDHNNQTKNQTLHDAVLHEQVNLVRLLCESNALMHGHYSSAEKLLNSYSNRNIFLLSPTELADGLKTLVQTNQPNKSKAFLEKIIPHFTSMQKDYVLLLLISEKNFDLAAELLNYNNIAAHEEKTSSDDRDFVFVTIEHGQVSVIEDKSGDILDLLLDEKRYDLVHALLQQKPSISLASKHPERLYCMMKDRQIDCANAFANIHVPTNFYDPIEKTTTLQLAIQYQNTQLIKKLLQTSALTFKNENILSENNEIAEAARFLASSEKPIDLSYLIDIKGNLIQQRRIAILILTECFAQAKTMEDVITVLEQLETLKPDYLYHRQKNGRLSLGRHQWSGSDTANTWGKVMLMGQLRLLELSNKNNDAPSQQKAEKYLNQKSTYWRSKDDTSAFKLFKKAPANQQEITKQIQQATAFKIRAVNAF